MKIIYFIIVALLFSCASSRHECIYKQTQQTNAINSELREMNKIKIQSGINEEYKELRRWVLKQYIECNDLDSNIWTALDNIEYVDKELYRTVKRERFLKQ